jgi:hypothetical protein
VLSDAEDLVRIAETGGVERFRAFARSADGATQLDAMGSETAARLSAMDRF